MTSDLRNSETETVLEALRRAWLRGPDLRLCPFIVNAAMPPLRSSTIVCIDVFALLAKFVLRAATVGQAPSGSCRRGVPRR